MGIIERPLVSIIIPVYNTEKYIRRALESVLTQTYTNIEVILVDDGSEDESGRICDEYARRNSSIKVIHQKNSGVSAARNIGIDTSAGEYIQFVDSDDEIKNTMIETFVNTMNEQECDIVICGYSIIREQTTEINIKTHLYNRNEFLILSYVNPKVAPIIWSSCNMMFKNSILKEADIHFDSSYVMGEDGLFVLEYLMKCKQVFVINQILYMYYSYQEEERKSAVSYFTPDVYELKIQYFKRLFSSLKFDISEQERTVLLQNFYNNLIPQLVYLVAYSEYFSKDDIEQRLISIVNNRFVIQAGKVYKRKRKSDSILIPLFMRWKAVKFLYLALEKRGKQYITRYGKRSMVGSIYKK